MELILLTTVLTLANILPLHAVGELSEASGATMSSTSNGSAGAKAVGEPGSLVEAIDAFCAKQAS